MCSSPPLALKRRTRPEAELRRSLARNAELETRLASALSAAAAACAEAPVATPPPPREQGTSGSERESEMETARRDRVEALYRVLTAIRVETVRDLDSAPEGASDDDAPQCDVVEFECVASAARGREARFTLSFDDDDVDFTPTAGAEHLPEYLRSSIEFDKAQCPVLLKNLLASLHTP